MRQQTRLPDSAVRHTGFTLIELLIVVAIIAILAAIAVPNFMEAQTRAKVSRVKADMRALGVALEAYKTDISKYPIDYATVSLSQQILKYKINFVRPLPNPYDQFFTRWVLTPLTTPIAYMSTLPMTGFDTVGSLHDNNQSFRYDGKNHGPEYSTSDYLGTDPAVYPGFPYCTSPAVGWTRERKWRLRDCGPDLWANNRTSDQALYDPSNGTVSWGDIIRWGPE